jgi:hypothetical protein
MRRNLGSARIEAIALAVVDRLGSTAGLRVKDRGAAVAACAKRLRTAFQVDEQLDAAVRARIASLRRDVPEGGREWELLYQQYLEELSRRQH